MTADASFRGLLAGLWILASVSAALGAKPILLRNEVISPTPPLNAPGPASFSPAAPAVSGLFLVQFTGPPQKTWRAQLGTMGVDLLRYVPQDTFVARFQNLSPGRVQALGFVTWVGPYRPEHKLHRSLAEAIQASVGNVPLRVSVLLAPRADRLEFVQARRLFQSVQQQSRLRQGTILRGTIQPAHLIALARSDAVLWIEPARDMKLFDEVSSKIVAGDGGPQMTLSQALGFDGKDVFVAVADTGLNNGDAATMHPDLFGRTPWFRAYGGLPDAADEHSHGTHVAGIIAGNGATGETDDNGALYGLGVAPGASILAQRVFDAAGNDYLPANVETLTRDATRAGAVIGSNSWGDDTQGRYDTHAAEFDELVRDADALRLGDQPYILEFSAGNAGPGQQTVGSPAVAKNVIATGASQNNRPDFMIYDQGQEAMADFSSRGPCEDGRIKPDVVAPGTWIASLKSASATDEYAWAPISDNYLYQGGTSQAGPHASGAAAVFVQFYRETHTNALPSPALVKAALINSAVPLDNPAEIGPVPNMDEGWGRVDLPQLLASSRSFDFADQTTLLETGQTYERRLVVASPDEPLNVTLVYTDFPGLPAAVPALVNDLDLEVAGPDGRVYRGNQFQDGESVPDATHTDTINNVEGVHLSAPTPGEYLIRVRGTRVVEDARSDAVGQDFALVSSGKFLGVGQSAVVLDRHRYTAPGPMRIKLIDRDLAGTPSVSVSAQSTSEPTPENVLLGASGSAGTFTGTVATAAAPAIAHDGRLQIADGDLIQVVYFDASLASNVIATALADLRPPVLTNVAVTNHFGHVIISWTSDEPANSIVCYSTNLALNLAVTNTAVTTDHAVALEGLTPGVTNYFLAISTDEAGNTATNTSGGQPYAVVKVPPATVLVVDAYTDLFFAVPPLNGYTDPLDQLGVSYDVFDATTGGSPKLADLLPYRAVFWRLPEFYGNAVNITWSPAEQRALQDYLQAGGSLLVASMEVLSRLDEAGSPTFRTNFLQVQAFTEDAGVAQLVGAANDPIGDGINVTLDYTVYEDWLKDLMSPPMPADVSDTFTPTLSAKPVFYDGNGAVVGLRYPRTGQDFPGRLVFLSFPLDAVPMSADTTNNRVHFLRNILGYLVPGVNGIGNVALDRMAYTIPDTVTVEVDDSNLAGAGTTAITFFSTTEAGGQSVTLHETTRRGTFRGTIQLVAATSAPAAGQLRVSNGDTLRAEYLDVSVQRTIRSSAAVDTQAPTLSAVAAEPDYEAATVTWATPEPADSQVQFGESALVDRSVFDASLATSHELSLRGLRPDTVYFFKVVSRDEAGNAVMDDNQGRLYSFRTLRPLPAPWADNFDTGATNWSVFSSDDSQVPWTLGVPNNGQATSAHSPPDAWGSNLRGDWIDYTETFLISPAIGLTGGNTATLTFWHSYDFTEKSQFDILEVGQVLIATNNIGAPIALAQFGDLTPTWEKVELDLTPYVGHVVYLVWAYQVLSLDGAARPGWLVDDVSITVSNVQPGTVVLSNNLWQAQWILTGPMNRKGRGLGTAITNAPPGQYVIEFADVPYYQTPLSQTNRLASDGTTLFLGDYTFTDANHNGIPDAWEQQVFGLVDPNRTASTDSDGDGLSDYAEFITGTNPLDSNSVFRVTATLATTNSPASLRWTATPGRAYRVHGRTNGGVWAPVSPWLPATTRTMKYPLPAPAPDAPSLFLLEVRP